jgi:putative heme transporter
MLLHGWKGILQAVAMVAITVGAGYAIYAERATVQKGLAVLPHLRVGWLLAGIGAECLSMLAFGQLQRSLLRAGGATLSLRSVLATVYRASAIAVAVPVVGSGLATASLYRDFRRSGTEPAQVSVALAMGGILSSVAFAVVVAAGALVTGNPAAAAAAVAGAAVGVVLAVVVGLALRFPSIRSWLAARITAMLRFSQRVIKRPRSDPEQTVGDMLTMTGGLRFGWRTVAVALVAALVNWLTDVACLICALKAAGAGIPWSAILIVWTAGAGAASFSPSPAGIGVVDIVLIAALAGAGISPAIAVAAVLLYRIVTFKIVITMASLAYYRLRKPATSPPEESAALVRGVPDDRREPRETGMSGSQNTPLATTSRSKVSDGSSPTGRVARRGSGPSRLCHLPLVRVAVHGDPLDEVLNVVASGRQRAQVRRAGEYLQVGLVLLDAEGVAQEDEQLPLVPGPVAQDAQPGAQVLGGDLGHLGLARA